jgi:hypothetical protein
MSSKTPDLTQYNKTPNRSTLQRSLLGNVDNSGAHHDQFGLSSTKHPLFQNTVEQHPATPQQPYQSTIHRMAALIPQGRPMTKTDAMNIINKMFEPIPDPHKEAFDSFMKMVRSK